MRIARWHHELLDFDFKIEFRQSERKKHVDALSREVYVIQPLTFEQELTCKQLSDPVLKEIRESLEFGESDKYEVRNGLLFRKNKSDLLFYVPESMTNHVIRSYHDEIGHVGVDKTVELILRVYWFPKLRKRVKVYIGSCLKCITFSVRSGKGERELHLWDRAKLPFEACFVDHYGPLEKSSLGYKYIFLIIDGYTKFVVFYPVKTTTSKETISKLENFIHHYGKSKVIVSDRGTCFTSDEFAKFSKNHEIKNIKVAAGTPRANGQAERVFRFLRSTLSKMEGTSDWRKKYVKRAICY